VCLVFCNLVIWLNIYMCVCVRDAFLYICMYCFDLLIFICLFCACVFIHWIYPWKLKRVVFEILQRTRDNPMIFPPTLNEYGRNTWRRRLEPAGCLFEKLGRWVGKNGFGTKQVAIQGACQSSWVSASLATRRRAHPFVLCLKTRHVSNILHLRYILYCTSF